MVRLSVIIPCYNAASTIGEQLDALASQDWNQRWEVLVVDNRCTDETMEIVDGYSTSIANLRVIDAHERQGRPYARNCGARAANAEALAFCDADDIVSGGWVAAMGDALSEHRFVAGRLAPYEADQSWISGGRPCPQQDGLQPYTYPPYLPHAAGCNLGIRRSVLESVGWFDEEFAGLEDTDLCWKVQKTGVPLQFITGAVVHYRLRSTLKAVFRQAVFYGEYNVRLYKRYRKDDMPTLPLRRGLKEWLSLARALARIRSLHDVSDWIWSLGWRIGRVKGSLKYAVLAL